MKIILTLRERTPAGLESTAFKNVASKPPIVPSAGAPKYISKKRITSFYTTVASSLSMILETNYRPLKSASPIGSVPQARTKEPTRNVNFNGVWFP